MLRFYLALWVAKFIAWVYRCKGDERNDRPGLYAFKLCPDFLARIAKPPLVIAITGTNGKTTTTALIAKKLRAEGLRVSYNDWGANLHAGYCLNLMRGATIFNRCKYIDASILEADEKTLPDTMGRIEPQYILVSNICKDSLRRNGHPEYIFDCIQRTLGILGEKTTAILNANDPISCELGKGTEVRRIFYGMGDIGADPIENIVKDIRVCPYCGEELRYHYRFYRHLGDFYCPGCGFQPPKCQWYAERVNLQQRTIDIREGDAVAQYPLISDTVFNAFNVLSAVACLRAIGREPEDIAEFLSSQKVTEIRETCVRYHGIEYYAYGTKSQNVSAASTVFEYMAKEPSDKNVVFCLDELQDKNHPTETLTWLYETDYEVLNSPNIKKIIVGGHMFLNHKLRLLLAGVAPDKIIAVEDESAVPLHVDTEGIQKVYVLYEIDFVTKGRSWRDAIVRAAKQKWEGEALTSDEEN